MRISIFGSNVWENQLKCNALLTEIKIILRDDAIAGYKKYAVHVFFGRGLSPDVELKDAKRNKLVNKVLLKGGS